MSTQSLQSPVVSASALRSVNFFNGRLLTGDDLSEEQSTQGARLQQLGKLTGQGIAFGLEVQETAGTSTAQNPIVTVNAGLALSPSGLILSLPAPVDVALATSTPSADSEPGGLFAPCQPFAPGTYTAGAGVYLLWIGPASQGEGLAAVNGLGNQTAPCNVDDYITTVQFGLIRINLSPAQLNDTQHLRNLVAYMCFAPNILAAFTADPFGTPPTDTGLIHQLRGQLLTADQVPLAIFGWDDDDGIEFVDLWSVRRRLIPRAGEGPFGAFVSARRRAEGEAMFLQFQAAIDDLRTGGVNAGSIKATDYLLYLPPVGLVPLQTSSEPNAFDQETFFAGIPWRDPVFLEGSRVDAVINSALAYPPVNLSTPEAIRLYVVRENQEVAPGQTPPPPFVLVTSGHVPYAADARYDLAYWDYANYAEM